MDIDKIHNRFKNQERIFLDILGKRLFPEDVVVYASNDAVKIGIIEKFTPTGAKILNDNKIRYSGTLLSINHNESIEGIKTSLIKKLSNSNKEKAIKAKTNDKYVVFLKKIGKDLFLGELHLVYTKKAEKIKQLNDFLNANKDSTIRFLTKFNDDIFFSGIENASKFIERSKKNSIMFYASHENFFTNEDNTVRMLKFVGDCEEYQDKIKSYEFNLHQNIKRDSWTSFKCENIIDDEDFMFCNSNDDIIERSSYIPHRAKKIYLSLNYIIRQLYELVYTLKTNNKCLYYYMEEGEDDYNYESFKDDLKKEMKGM